MIDAASWCVLSTNDEETRDGKVYGIGRQAFKSPGPQPNGIQAAEDALWVVDQVNLKVHKLDWDSGEVLHEFDTETEHSSGITLGDDAVWIASTYELEIVKIDPADGKTLARYPDPGRGITVGRELIGDTKESGAHGLEYRDGKVYVASPPTQRGFT